MSVLKAIEQARERHRVLLEETYEDSCTILEYRSVKDPVTKITNKQEVTVVSNQRCKLSYSSSKTTEKENHVSTKVQTISLFLSSSIEIQPGSKIVITRKGETEATAYMNSGVPARYMTHQEIQLELFERWA
ncbi:MAG TPA: hypothetical protein VHP81_13750 [Lachnospiraceae bacterium]|nr:hypothetical protein [Lachnospiraceae bacterium]